MKITEEQNAILEELICERLRDNPNSSALIQNFENEKGTLIVDYLKQYGLKEDLEGSTAFYIVRNKDNDVLMFFSLKCGELFDSLFDEDEIEAGYEEHLLIIQALKNVESDEEAKNSAIEKIKEISDAKGISMQKALNLILRETKTKQKMLSFFNKERETEGNEKISRVSKTYPGIELVHFCTNDNTKKIWESYGLGHSLGEVIFWKKIVPKFFEVQSIVGCEYAFLFAADLSEDRTLINYYDVSLKFEIDVEVGTNKPLYDFTCAFMCQKLSDMKKNQESYFNNFNIDDNDEIV